MNTQLKVGDVVRLKSGGPWMTVRSVKDGESQGVCIGVEFFSDQNAHVIRDDFSPDVLELRLPDKI